MVFSFCVTVVLVIERLYLSLVKRQCPRFLKPYCHLASRFRRNCIYAEEVPKPLDEKERRLLFPQGDKYPLRLFAAFGDKVEQSVSVGVPGVALNVRDTRPHQHFYTVY